MRSTQVSIHRALAIGRDEDQTPRGRRVTAPRRSGKIDPPGTDIVGEDLAELVIRNLPNKRALRAKRCQAGQRIGGRTPGNLACRAHRLVKRAGAISIDQRHCAFCQAEPCHLLLGSGRHDIDDGVADGDDIKARGDMAHAETPGWEQTQSGRSLRVAPLQRCASRNGSSVDSERCSGNSRSP